MAARAAICAGATLTAWLLHERWPAAGHVLFTLAYLSGAHDLALAVWEDLRQRSFNTEFLMLLVAAGAATIGAHAEGALLLVLFSSSAAMEEFASGRTTREINALLKGAPKTARLLEAGHELEVTVESLQPGQHIRVTANETVPVDIEVTHGSSACDESTLTGEAEPIPKTPGDTALAGTLNLWGVVEGRVLRSAGDSALQRIIRLIHDAQQRRAPAQRFTDRFGTAYTAAVIAACLGLFLFCWLVLKQPPFLAADGRSSAFYRAMTLLVVLSPCALVLSVPSAILSAIACGARHGVLFRGGAAVEHLAEVGAVAMDKTGTLTEGALRLTDVQCHEGTEEKALQIAGGLARLSNHPISRSLAREIARRGVVSAVFPHTETIAGQGIRTVAGEPLHALGNRALIGDRIPPELPAEHPDLPPSTSETWVLGPGVLARLRLHDQLRPEAATLVKRLQADGLRTIMLTGDRESSAHRLAQEAGLKEYRAQLRPEDKVAAVEELKRAGCSVAMIGDGVNDAPVLAAADVGIAMGARGSDAALEQADVVLMNDRLENFLFARQLSLRARGIIRQNLVISLGTMTLMALLTLGFAGVPLSVGVAAHEGSTVIVVLNSLRLLFSPRPR